MASPEKPCGRPSRGAQRITVVRSVPKPICWQSEAIRLYLRGIDADVIVEAFHRGLMRCYRCAGRLTEAVSAYRRLRQTLSVVLGIAPSAESEALHREIIAELANAPAASADTVAPPASVASLHPIRAALRRRR
jgi:DNA-binding SARP family transcriptional activator